LKNIVIVGGGLAGLFTAYALIKNCTHPENIIIIDRENEVGGLLNSFDYGINGKFDHGAHFFQESGNVDLDRLFKSILPSQEWIYFENYKRDLAGTYFNGKLQTDTQYINLKNLSETDFQVALTCFFDNFNKNAGKIASLTTDSAYEYLNICFGKHITSKYIAPGLEKTFGRDLADLSLQALSLLPTNRISLFDEEAAADILDTNLLKKLIAYPEQRNLPSNKSTNKKSFYPSKFGLDSFVKSLENTLLKAGVKILTNTKVCEIITEKNIITNLVVEQDQKQFKLQIDHIVWTVPMFSFASLLKVASHDLKIDRPQKTVLINLLLDEKPAMKDLYYFYCHEPDFFTYRVTNFSNYCSNALVQNKYPLTVELLLNPIEKFDFDVLKEKVLQEIISFGILNNIKSIPFLKIEPLASGFPMPTVKNVNSMNTLRSRVLEKGFKNILFTGTMAEKDLFYQNDVLIDAFTKANQLLEKL